MSKTTRKSGWLYGNEAVFISEELADYSRRPYEFKNVKRSEEEYNHRLEEAKKDYARRIKENGGSDQKKQYCWSGDGTFRFYTIRMSVPSVRKTIKVPMSKERAIAKAKLRYNKLHRDCHSETSRSTGFKDEANRFVRKTNKQFCSDVMMDKDYENIAYPIRKEGKKFRWNHW